MRVPVDQFEQVVQKVLSEALPRQQQVQVLADVLMDNELDGVHSHGVRRLDRFFEMIRQGYLKPDAEPALVRAFGAVEQWDGCSAPGVLNAMHSMSRAMAREVGGDGITVNAVLPGMIETEIENTGRSEEGRAHVIGSQSLQRQQTPEDMVGTLLFLASPASGFMTGQSICVDGGAAFV